MHFIRSSFAGETVRKPPYFCDPINCILTLSGFRSSSVLLSRCSTVLLFYCSAVSLFLCSTVPLFFCSSVLLFRCSSVLLFRCSSVLLFRCSSVLLFRCSAVLLFFCSAVLLFYCSAVLPIPRSHDLIPSTKCLPYSRTVLLQSPVRASSCKVSFRWP